MNGGVDMGSFGRDVGEVLENRHCLFRRALSFLLEMAQPHCLPRPSQDSGSGVTKHPCTPARATSYQHRLWPWSRVGVGAWATKPTVALWVCSP